MEDFCKKGSYYQKKTSYSKFPEYVKRINLYVDVLKVRLKIFKNNKFTVWFSELLVLDCGILQVQ